MPTATLTAVVAALGIVLSFAARGVVQWMQDKTRFELAVAGAIAEIDNRMQVAAGVLRSAQGFFQSSTEVERVEWETFVGTLAPDLESHGILYLSCIFRVAPGGLDAFERSHQALVPDFHVRRFTGPAPADHRVWTYAEPAHLGAGVLGTDGSLNPSQRAALDLALGQDRPVVDGPDCLDPRAPDAGCVYMLLPVFTKGPVPHDAQERRERLVGWVAAVLRSSALLDAREARALDGIDLEIVAGGTGWPEAVLYDSDPDHAYSAGAAFRRRELLQLGVASERPWTAQFSTLPGFGADTSRAPGATLAVGLVVTALAAALVWALATTRSRALALAEEMSQSARSALAEVEVQRDRVRSQTEELERARDQALDATRAKSEFLATVSHEIRTPMTGIVGMTSLLMETPLSAEQREYAGHVRTSADQLLAIVNDLLDFSKVEAGRLTVEARPFDLRDVCEGAMKTLRPLADAKGLPLVLSMTRGTPTQLVGDALRIRQVLVNLLANAVKFSDSGDVRVVVDAPEQTAGDALIRIAVTDRGIGIHPDVLPKLFEPFTQADASTTRRFGGTGLGLAICKSLVELMGGTLSADSRAGEGSTFRFTVRLPIAGPPV